MNRFRWFVLMVLFGTPLAACDGSDQAADTAPPVKSTGDVHPELAAHSKTFEKGVVKVTDGVHVAIGYGLANSIHIEAPDGVIIVDAMESIEAARDVKAAFDGLSDKPVKAIVYTHNHADHIFGAEVLAGDDGPEIISHATTADHVSKIVNVLRPIIQRRSMRQFGTNLSDAELVNDGIGPRLRLREDTPVAYLQPTRTVGDTVETMTIAGERFEFHFAPGETPDQLFVYLPDRKVLLPADNFYKSFPNLYAIRGTAYRDVRQWAASLDRMLALDVEYLVPSHTRPVTGKQAIARTLTDYRDAIQYVHDQTVRYMNMGLTPDEIVERVKLPAHLAEKPYLKEFYGRVDWAVRSIFTGYLGWFSGNATDLNPLPRAQEAQRLAELAGGVEVLRKKTRMALAAGQYQWALQLADRLLALDGTDDSALAIRADALTALGRREISATGRNYYLTQAMEARGHVIPLTDPGTTPESLLRQFPIRNFLEAMTVSLNAEDAIDENVVVGFRFPDLDEGYTMTVRQGVAVLSDGYPKNPVAGITADSFVWKEVMSKRRNVVGALVSGDVTLEGGKLALLGFLSLFEPPE